jgi:UDP-3-O-[3-hydroxymyristoyl] glucosamine N-acyltransferase
MNFKATELLNRLPSDTMIDGDLEGITLSNIKSIFEADANSLTWLNPTRADRDQLVEKTNAKVLICDKDYDTKKFKNSGKCFLKVGSPKLTFLRLVGHFFTTKPKPGIHPSTVVHAEAKIHPSVHIGPNCYIGNCSIDEGSVLYGNTYLYDNTRVGKNVFINACTVIGGDGFGYARNEDNILEKFPHIGGVLIEDDVEIGGNTCIDRGTLGDTVIKKGVKIDNLVHIAHNVMIGEHTMVIANSMIGGSTVIGPNSWIAPSASLRDAITIGKGALVGMGAVVTKNIPADQTWTGNPAREINALKTLLKKMDEL